jgi:hypothetical protein
VGEKVSEPSASGPSRSLDGIDPPELAAEDITTRERIRRPGPWTAVPSHIARDRSYMKCSLQARHLHLMAWLYSNRERVDGKLGRADFRSVAAESQLSELEAIDAAAELVAAGLWRPGDEPRFELVGFLDWNLCAEAIGERAAAARARMQKVRAAQKGSPNNPSKTEVQNTQNTQERSPERSIERVPNGTNGTAETPEASKQRLETAQRLKELGEKFRLPAVPVG